MAPCSGACDWACERRFGCCSMPTEKALKVGVVISTILLIADSAYSIFTEEFSLLTHMFDSEQNFSDLIFRFYVLLCACMLLFNALVESEKFYHLFGFMRYTSGVGWMMVLIGLLVLGISNNTGTEADDILGNFAGGCTLLMGVVHWCMSCAGRKEVQSDKMSEPLAASFVA